MTVTGMMMTDDSDDGDDITMMVATAVFLVVNVSSHTFSVPGTILVFSILYLNHHNPIT